MCECRNRIEGLLLGRAKEMYQGTDHQVELGGYVFGVDGDGALYSRPSLPVTGSYKHTTKGGKVVDKKISQFMRASYCPFCGERLDAESAA